jgi:hypothetical protein
MPSSRARRYRKPPLIDIEAGSQQRAVTAFMEALGGEIRPDAEAEQAFAAARAQRMRPAIVAGRRSPPPLS